MIYHLDVEASKTVVRTLWIDATDPQDAMDQVRKYTGPMLARTATVGATYDARILHIEEAPYGSTES